MSETSHDLISEPFPPILGRMRAIALLVGLVSLALCAVGYSTEPAHFFRSWLFAYIFWVGLTLGCMTMVMITHMTGGEWGVVIRRFGETAFMNMPLMLVCFLPLIAGYKYLFPWAHIETYVDNEKVYAVLQHRAPWLNPTMFTVRNIGYMVIFSILAFTLNSGSRKMDRADAAAANGLRDRNRDVFHSHHVLRHRPHHVARNQLVFIDSGVHRGDRASGIGDGVHGAGRQLFL